MFFKIIVLKQVIKNSSSISSSMQSKTENSLTFSSLYHPLTILQNMFFFFIFVATAIAVFFCTATKIVVYVCCLFIRRFQVLSAIFRIFLITLYVTWFCFSKKIASRHPFHYLLIKIFQSLRKSRQGLPENFVNLIFKVIFYVALYNLYVFPMFRRSSL